MMNEYSVFFIGIISILLIKVLCFWLGYKTIQLGHKLMNDGIKGGFKFTANYNGLKGGLISSSPGLLYVFLGVLLIGYAMYVKKPITFETHTGENTTQEKRALPHDSGIIIKDSLP